MIVNKATFKRWLADAKLPDSEAAALLAEYNRGSECARQATEVLRRKLTRSPQSKPAVIPQRG